MNHPEPYATSLAGNRRLPVYFLLDCSGSSAGRRIEQYRNAILELTAHLRKRDSPDVPIILTIVGFQGRAFQFAPLTPAGDFDVSAAKLSQIDGAGTTALGAALELVGQSLKADLVQRGGACRGDGAAMVFVFTDSEATDRWEEALDSLAGATMVFCGDSAEISDYGSRFRKRTLHLGVHFLSPSAIDEMSFLIDADIERLRKDQQVIVYATGG